MGQRDRRHADGSARRRGWLWWLPLALVLVLAAGTFGYLRLADQPNPLPFPVPGLPSNGPLRQLALPELSAPAEAAPAVSTPIDVARVRAALAAYAHGKGLGNDLHLAVGGVDGGPTFTQHDDPMMPASTMKLLTMSAALHVLGPSRTFHTTVTRPDSRTVVLVGGGDPYLEATPQPGDFPARADLTTLAAQVATEVGHRKVRLGYDTSLFTGPEVSPDWPATYVPENVVAPISPLWVNRGWTAQGVVADPALVAARAFAKALITKGVRVQGAPTPMKGDGPQIGEVTSAPVDDIVESIITHSDNEAAEVLARQTALALKLPGSFAGAARAVRQTIAGLGVPLAGSRILDGSGLSRKDRLTPSILLAVLRLDARVDTLRPVITGLPVGGFSGSLDTRFTTTPKAAAGLVRAKTGTLTGVSGLAGIALDQGRDPIVFVMLSDKVPYLETLDARDSLDRLAAALATCRCH